MYLQVLSDDYELASLWPTLDDLPENSPSRRRLELRHNLAGRELRGWSGASRPVVPPVHLPASLHRRWSRARRARRERRRWRAHGNADASRDRLPGRFPYEAVCGEQFGPLVLVAVYDDPQEFVEYVRESNYGQQASIVGQDPAAVGRIAEQLVNLVCRVNVNAQCQLSGGHSNFIHTGFVF